MKSDQCPRGPRGDRMSATRCWRGGRAPTPGGEAGRAPQAAFLRRRGRKPPRLCRGEGPSPKPRGQECAPEGKPATPRGGERGGPPLRGLPTGCPGDAAQCPHLHRAPLKKRFSFHFLYKHVLFSQPEKISMLPVGKAVFFLTSINGGETSFLNPNTY